jgi:hypothetical protein
LIWRGDQTHFLAPSPGLRHRCALALTIIMSMFALLFTSICVSVPVLASRQPDSIDAILVLLSKRVFWLTLRYCGGEFNNKETVRNVRSCPCGQAQTARGVNDPAFAGRLRPTEAVPLSVHVAASEAIRSCTVCSIWCRKSSAPSPIPSGLSERTALRHPCMS